MATSTTLISFDVDGTLIQSIGETANFLHKQAFAHGIKEICNIDTSIDVMKHHGSTDPLIVVAVLMHHGISYEQAMEKLPAIEASMVEYFVKHQNNAAQGIEILPGVLALLKALKALPNVATCLVTGNLEPIGWGKMTALGVLDCFTVPLFGGFGSDFCSGNTAESWKDRAELVKVAATKAAALHAGGIGARYHVGDTPMDIKAAQAAGAVAIGVTTGIFTRAELEEVGGPDAIILDDLRNLDQVLAALKLPGAAR